MIDPDGMMADSVKVVNLNEVLVSIKRSPNKLPPFEGFWGNLDYYWNGGKFGGTQYDKQGFPIGDAPITGVAPDIGLNKGVNTIYKGVKNGLPYMGKTFNILKRYTKAQRLELQVRSVIEGIPNSKLLRAIEQKALEYKKSLGEVANKVNAFDPKRKDYPEYMQKATEWLETNVPHWKELFD